MTPFKPILLVRSILPYWVATTVILSIIWVGMGDISGVYSTVFGAVFGLLGFWRLAHDQFMILSKESRKMVMAGLLIRLGIYAIPIGVSLNFADYFKFWIILICLFKSQVIFILRELIINYMRYRRRQKIDG